MEAHALALKQGDRIVIPADANFSSYLTNGNAPEEAEAQEAT